jgi:glutamate dehydrogenase
MKTPLSTTHYDINLSELIAQILSHLPENADALTRDFVRHYYEKMPVLELMRLQPQEACNIALNSLPFFKQKHDRVQIRSFVPDASDAGWNGHYLVIEVHNDDHAFILDSLRAEFIRQGFDFVNIIHPVFFLKRNKKGELIDLVDINESGDLPTGAKAESFIHFQLAGAPASINQEILIQDLHRVLNLAELVVDDFTTMDKKCEEAIREVVKLKGLFESDEIEEVKAFLNWLREKHYVFLGYMEYDFTKGNQDGLHIVKGSELGVFRVEDETLRPKALGQIPDALIDKEQQTELIEVTKSNRRSSVHRSVLMDYIAIKRYDAKGKLIGERRFLGMFTSMVYYQSAERIPFIRQKISRTLARANYDPMGHNGKALKAILEFYPRDELFQISQDQLYHFSISLMTLEAKPDVRLLVRMDRYERFVSCMVFIPRDRFSSYLREQIISILEQHYEGKIRDFYTQLTDSPLARLHLIIETNPSKVPHVEIAEIEAQIARITNRWADALRSQLDDRFGIERADALMPVYADAFPDAYIEQQDAGHATDDIFKIEECIERGGLAVDLFRRKRAGADHYHLKIYTYQSERALSDMLPVLEHFGCWVKEVRPYTIKPRWQHNDILIRDFHLHLTENDAETIAERKAQFETALREVWQYRTSNDAFNALVLAAGLHHREINVIRAFAHYLRQVGFAYSNRYIAEALGKHPEACQQLIAAFHAKCDPHKSDHAAQATEQLKGLERYLSKVKNAAEDRVIRRFSELMAAALRTNYFQEDANGEPKHYLSIKFRSSEVPDLPKPIPFAEIFVYSMRTEGIHLRGDAVARGGLRWSDRHEDYRTEVLGLVKAQLVKNAVIVPQGAKGGFVVKNPQTEGGRDAMFQEGIACYKEFLCGLLDITDNLKNQKVVPPQNVVRHDDDDPYLVVAADKGTASFSDIANGVAADYDFWLGDAFASGGSAGYDHKEMGITARGAWVSVERHFMEMGKDIRTEPFTVIGIGDMSGDVFGNGMLLSEHIQLVAAFNHKHIFIDPTPDAAKSFKERARLFALERSGWNDYNTKLISKGGGVFSRDEKSITLSKQAATVLGCEAGDYAPDALIKMILKAPAELLWNGGIGTYVKASDEAHSQVGDHANNAVRVNGEELRCHVVGEGGNLGLTQRGRIEFAMAGGRLNTDAIDNSAGVDCSDHEVNIKIALREAMNNGTLALEDRNELLEQMTDSVAQLVLIDNRLQTQAITIAQYGATAQLEPLARMMRRFEQDGFLDRAVEFLPGEKQLAERRAQNAGLTRPELSVLLSYAKLSFYGDIKHSAMVRDDYFIDDLLRYFPEAMRAPYRAEILSHRLRPDIVATMLTNSIINRAGISFAYRIGEETGVHPCDIARAYVITRDAFKLRALWSEIEALGNHVEAKAQSILFMAVQQFVENMTRWFLRNCPEPIQITETMHAYQKGIEAFSNGYEPLMSKTLHSAYVARIEEFTSCNVPNDLAQKIAALEVMASACDVVKVANALGADVAVVGRTYFELGAHLRLGWLRRSASKLLSEGYWERQAIHSIIRELYVQQRRLSADALAGFCSKNGDCEKAFKAWCETHKKQLARYELFIQDLKSQEVVDLPMIVVALRKIEEIAST